MALVVGFVLLLILEPPLGIVALVGGLIFEAGELVFWTRYLKRFRVKTGPEGLIGKRGVVLDDCSSEAMGQVRVRGELWRARCPDGVVAAVGSEVAVSELEGLTLTVEPTGRAG